MVMPESIDRINLNFIYLHTYMCVYILVKLNIYSGYAIKTWVADMARLTGKYEQQQQQPSGHRIVNMVHL